MLLPLFDLQFYVVDVVFLKWVHVANNTPGLIKLHKKLIKPLCSWKKFGAEKRFVRQSGCPANGVRMLVDDLEGDADGVAGSGVGEHEFARGAADEGATTKDAHGLIIGRGEMEIQFGQRAGKGFELIGTVEILHVLHLKRGRCGIVVEEKEKLGSGGAGEDARKFEITHVGDNIDRFHVDSF